MKIIFFLSAVLLIKQCLGGAVDTSTTYELTPAGEAFRNAVISKFAALAEEPNKLGKKLLEDTHADDANHQDARVYSVIGAFMSAFEKVDLDKESGKIESFLAYLLLFDLINGVAIGEEDQRELFQAVKVEFDKHNITGIANDIQLKFDEFLAWLTQELETKSDSLTTQEQLRAKAFKALCQQFKEETDFKKKDALSDDIVAKIK